MVQVEVGRHEGGGVCACLRGSGSGGSSEGAEGWAVRDGSEDGKDWLPVRTGAGSGSA